ncbi:hypothetical protein HKX48_005206 [Thoreauomyces humboldtii]|nr:hypothetical protein HKX48_005206 [Thoreauomyces humboldtii]
MTASRIPAAGKGVVHQISAKGFNLQTKAYEAARPTYPSSALQYLTQSVYPKIATDPGQVSLVDLASGTGKFTRLLLPYRLGNLTAVEPNEGMRAEFAQQLPNVKLLEGTSTTVPLPDASVDVITVAQAFHWFANAESLEEMARVLKKGGIVALIWNLEAKTGLSGHLRGLYESFEAGTPQYRLGLWRKALYESKEFDVLFEPATEKTFSHTLDFTADETWLRILSKSYISCLDENAQKELEVKARAAMAAADVPWEDRTGADGHTRRVTPTVYDTNVVWFTRK